MEYAVEEQENGHTIVRFSVPSEEIKPKLDEKYKAYQQKVNLEGFRKGKVPKQLLKKMYSKAINGEVFEPYLNEAWKKVFKEDEFDVLGTPQVENINFDAKEGLTFNIVFDTNPEIELKGYDGLAVERVTFEVNDEQVEQILKSFQERNAMLYSVDGEAQKGHILDVDLQEVDRTGVPIIGEKQKNSQLWLTDDNPATEQLLGVKAGEERKVRIVSNKPKSEIIEEQNQESVLDVNYLVKVSSVKERKLPELNDEFAKDMGAYETLHDLQNDIENNLKSRAETKGKTLFRRALADEFIKLNDFQAPPSMVEHYLDEMVKDLKEQNKGKSDFDEQEIRGYYKASAVRNIKWYLLQKKLTEVEGIHVTDEEIEEKIQEIEASGDSGAEQAKKIRENSEERKSLADMMLEDKIYDFLASKAQIQDVKKNWNQVESEGLEKEDVAAAQVDAGGEEQDSGVPTEVE